MTTTNCNKKKISAISCEVLRNPNKQKPTNKIKYSKNVGIGIENCVSKMD